MSKIIARSHSAIKTFDTCPRQYEARYIIKDVKFVQGPEAKWGDYVHNCLHHYVEKGVPLPPDVVQYQKYADAIIRLAKRFSNYQIICEQSIGLRQDFTQTGYFDKDVWYRVKMDVMVVTDSGIGFVFDYKTGKFRPDWEQLETYAFIMFKLYPSIMRVKVGDVWLKEPHPDPPMEFMRKDVPMLEQRFMVRNRDLDRALESGIFPAKTSGLCHGWCDVKRCEHWKPKRN